MSYPIAFIQAERKEIGKRTRDQEFHLAAVYKVL